MNQGLQQYPMISGGGRKLVFPERTAEGRGRLLIYLAVIFHVAAVLLLIWTVSVPLEQALWQSRASKAVVIHHEKNLLGNLDHSRMLIRISAALMVLAGCLTGWVHRRISVFTGSLENTMQRILRGEPNVQLRALKGFEALADIFNHLTAHYQQVEHRLVRINRLMAAIIDCHRVMMTATNANHVNQQITDALVETGKYHTAWMGYLSEKSGTLVIKAWSGSGLTDTVPAFWMDTEYSPVRRAIQNRHPALIHDIMNEPSAAFCREDARRLEYTSVVSLPIVHPQHEVAGVLTVYAQTSQAFNTDELRLLAEFVRDLTSCEPWMTISE
jgi:putative methionine-R-sulfoxide reductase with GAF domain